MTKLLTVLTLTLTFACHADVDTELLITLERLEQRVAEATKANEELAQQTETFVAKMENN